MAVESEEEGVKGLCRRLEHAVGSWTRSRVDLAVHLEGGLGARKGAEEQRRGRGKGAGAGGKVVAGDGGRREGFAPGAVASEEEEVEDEGG